MSEHGLNGLRVRASTDRDEAASILRANGDKFRNEVVGAALKNYRSSRSSLPSGTASRRDG